MHRSLCERRNVHIMIHVLLATHTLQTFRKRHRWPLTVLLHGKFRTAVPRVRALLADDRTPRNRDADAVLDLPSSLARHALLHRTVHTRLVHTRRECDPRLDSDTSIA